MDSEKVLEAIVAREFERLRAIFEERGLRADVGFGDRPALLVVDMIEAFTDPSSPFGADATTTVDEIARLLAAARQADLPIYFSTCHASFEPVGQPWLKKIPSQRLLQPGSRWVEIDARLRPRSEETVFAKHFASCFCGTYFGADLAAAHVDTLVVTGMTTSGCVRATVVDAVSNGLRAIVAKEAVADRVLLPHLASLFDMDAKGGDVVSTTAVERHFARAPAVHEGGSRAE